MKERMGGLQEHPYAFPPNIQPYFIYAFCLGKLLSPGKNDIKDNDESNTNCLDGWWTTRTKGKHTIWLAEHCT